MNNAPRPIVRLLKLGRTSWKSTLAACALVGAATAGPAQAAMLGSMDQWQPLLLLGSGVLLVIALGLKVATRRHTRTHHGATIGGEPLMATQSTGTIGDYRISRPWNR
jgi:hypothetical protein